MRFVLANRLMTFVGGTEVHLVTIGDHLRRLGHDVVIYSPEIGPYGDYARRSGIDVVGELRELPPDCDVVFAQDSIVAYDMAERYPAALFVFRVCGDALDFQLPPQLEGVVDVVVALSDRYARVVEASAVKAPCVRLRVPIDVDRRVPIGKPRKRPRRAVLLGNYPDRYETVRDAWEPLGVEVAQVGHANGGRQSFDVAAALADADIVVAKTRSALDAMACGRPVYVYDMFGGDGWVTPDLYPALEADLFSGQATARTIDRPQLERDLADYDPAMGAVNRDLVRQHHDARGHVVELLAAIAQHTPQERPRAPLRELSRLTSLQWSWQQIAHGHERTAAGLKGHLLDAERRETEARADADALRAQIDQMRGTRAWRTAARYWRLKQRVRERAASAGPAESG